MRRFGEPYVEGAPYRDRPGAYGVIGDGQGRVLLAATTAEGEDYLLPGGGIDPGESPLQALHREVMEETGWRIAAPLRIGAFQRYAWMPEYQRWARKVCLIYRARAIRPYGAPTEPDHTPVWMEAREAARLLSVEGDREVLRAALARDISF